MKKLTLLLCFAIPLLCMAQNSLARQYEYDASGNRTARKVLDLKPPQFTPPPPTPPEDPTLAETEQEETTTESLSLLSSPSPKSSEPEAPEYFIEKIAQVELKIYPNPTTEKITFEILGFVETRLIVSLQLYSLTGQLLQTHPVRSTTTTISLAGFPAGTYILKVQINDRIEDWKIIKH